MDVSRGIDDDSYYKFLTGELRAKKPELIDPEATDDPLGIFKEGKKALTGQVVSFFIGTLKSVVELERMMMKDSGTSNPLKQTTLGFVELTIALARILYYSEDPVKRDEILYTGGGKKVPRFWLRHRVRLYSPHDLSEHNQEIIPPTEYDFLNPAIVQTEVRDNSRAQSLIFTFHPIEYSFFKGHEELSGVSPAEGKAILHERARDLREATRIDEIVNAARKAQLKPGFRTSLIRKGIEVSAIQGDLTPAGFEVYVEYDPKRTVFQPHNFQAKRVNGEPPIPLRSLVEGFLNLKLKS